MEELKEKALIKAAQKGDLKAFETLISEYEQTIYTLCLRMLQKPEEAFDATQEVCIKIWKQLDRFEGQSKLSTWIYRIATNQCLDLLRKNKKHQGNISLFQKDEAGEEWLIQGEVEGAHEEVLQKELQEVVAQALTEIKPDYRAIIVLRDMEDYSYEEIAEILGLSLGTVKSRLSRARKALKKVLWQNKEPYCSFFRQNK